MVYGRRDPASEGFRGSIACHNHNVCHLASPHLEVMDARVFEIWKYGNEVG